MARIGPKRHRKTKNNVVKSFVPGLLEILLPLREYWGNGDHREDTPNRSYLTQPLLL